MLTKNTVYAALIAFVAGVLVALACSHLSGHLRSPWVPTPKPAPAPVTPPVPVTPVTPKPDPKDILGMLSWRSYHG